MLVSAVRRGASGVLSTRSRISVGGRCSDCLYVVRYWPASSALHARGVGMWFRRLVRGCLRPGYDDSDVVEQTDFRQLSNGILVFRLRSRRMSGMRKSKAGTTHDVTYEEQYAEVVGLA